MIRTLEKKNSAIKNVITFLGLGLLMILIFGLINGLPAEKTYNYSEIIEKFKTHQVTKYTLNLGSGDMQITLKDNSVINYTSPSASLIYMDIKDYVNEYNEQNETKMVYNITKPTDSSWFMSILLPLIVSALLLSAMGWMFLRKLSAISGENNKQFGFGKAKLKDNSKNKKRVTFADVAGADEEKEELAEIVDFLKTPDKYTSMGARIPKGLLLVGPPGTGKTLLAKAVAGEADVPFFSISGSDFVEMFVGDNEGVIVIAATNRSDILDPALTRPGRFDREIYVGRPDIKGREEILKVHLKGKTLAPDVDLKVIAKRTVGFTGADLENLLNEAAILSVKRGLGMISMAEIEESVMKVSMGPEKKSRIITEEEKKQTAYHEAGHAIATYFCKTQEKVHEISIIPRGSAGGYTLSLPEKDENFRFKKKFFESIIVLLGGMAAEKIILNDTSTGVSSDIKRATQTARAMVTEYGMSDELGPIVFDCSNAEPFFGRDGGQVKNYSESTATVIDAEVKKIVTDCYEKSQNIIKENIGKLHDVANFLLANEKMTQTQFENIMNPTEI